MNAIVALCHFCPEHGPRTLFCTQAFKYSDLPNNIEKSSSSDLNSKDESSTKNGLILDAAQPEPLQYESNDSTEKLNSLIQSQSSSPSQLTTTRSNEKTNSLDKSTANCKPCRAFDGDFHHYISYEKTIDSTNIDENSLNNRICYISQSQPNDTEVFSLVRKACLRTLHCEVFEDPIYFDDDKNGSVIGYEFNIKDSEGRGQQRSYSLIIIMKDRIYLQHLWSFLSQQISIIASNIKMLAQKKFERDQLQGEKDSTNNHIFAFSSSASSNPTIGSGSSLPFKLTHLREKKSSKLARGLIELTDDKYIFAKLHMWFTWILRMSSCQISEDWVTGPIDEDSQIRLEREQLNEFLKSPSNKQNVLTNNKELNKKLNDLSKSLSDYSISYFNSNGVNQNLDDNNDENIESGNLTEHDNENFLNNVQVDSLRQLLKLIGYDYFHQLAYNTIIGNQVIVRGKYEKLISSIIRTLEELIPLGCCKSVYYSNEYLKSYQCKLLGLSDQVNLFKTISRNDENGDNQLETNFSKNVYSDLNEYILIDLIIEPKNTENLSSSNDNNKLHSLIRLNLLDLINESNEFNVVLKTNVNQITQVPSFLNKVESYLFNEKLDDSSISCLIKQAKEEWLNKTKVFYKFIQSPNVQTKTSSDVVLKMLNLSKDDELALRHWQAGLSNECKVQIRTS